jgi:hypothetical protein
MPPVGGAWIVVFETGGWGDGPIKLSQRAVGEYFSRGFRFRTESAKKKWNPFEIFIMILPARITSQNAEARREAERRERALLAAQDAAALERVKDDPLCVWFRRGDQEHFDIAEKRRCGGCPETALEASERTYKRIAWTLWWP